ncbi:histidine phosphatase family protein [Leadbetterella byssophila]|uniref:histidine phosphatase family protein n=1 Tax=Leadbetterella byssophila TaxID=316068 RepID=UPI001C9DFE73
MQQAKNIAFNLNKEIENKKFSIYSSTLKRTKQTAEIIAEQFNLNPIFTESLKERSLGKAIGKSVK